MKKFEINDLRESIGLPNHRQDTVSHISYHTYKKGNFSYLPNHKPFHLFFLLEGELFINNNKCIVRMTGPKFFCTDDNPQICNATEDARFIAIDFDELVYNKNQQFIDWLITSTNDKNKIYTPLVIHDTLLAVLDNVVKELCDGYDYLNIHETLTILLRLLYKTNLFSSKHLDENEDKQIQTTDFKIQSLVKSPIHSELIHRHI